MISHEDWRGYWWHEGCSYVQRDPFGDWSRFFLRTKLPDRGRCPRCGTRPERWRKALGRYTPNPDAKWWDPLTWGWELEWRYLDEESA